MTARIGSGRRASWLVALALVTFKHDFKLSDADRRKAKREALQAWPGP